MDVHLVSESSFEENIQGHSSPPPPPLNSFTQTSPSLSQDFNCPITFLAGYFAPYKGQPLPKPNSTVKQVWGSVPNLDRTSTTTAFRHELRTDVSIMEGRSGPYDLQRREWTPGTNQQRAYFHAKGLLNPVPKWKWKLAGVFTERSYMFIFITLELGTSTACDPLMPAQRAT